jgi:hypothetical protein
MDKVPPSAIGERDARRQCLTTITVMNATRDPVRDTAIGVAVDCLRNLTASVARFVTMLMDTRESRETPGGFTDLPLRELAMLLGRCARVAGFSRMHDLERAIESAVDAEEALYRMLRTSSKVDMGGLAELARQWEKLDATFVGLCVEHVLDRHADGNVRRETQS